MIGACLFVNNDQPRPWYVRELLNVDPVPWRDIGLKLEIIIDRCSRL